jgi:isoquinoline 1-oxidoreductase alpha subunit
LFYFALGNHRGKGLGMSITLTINGQSRTLSAPGDTPLLWALRDELGLTGTKYGCGVALCGACTVHADGVPIRSCSTPIDALAGVTITTIEGLATAGDHPVQQAWRKLDVVQCGYCQSGQIMAAAALLAGNANPTDADIDAAMSGNICRCATYHRVRAAIKEAATIAAGTQTAPPQTAPQG